MLGVLVRGEVVGLGEVNGMPHVAHRFALLIIVSTSHPRS